MIRRLVPEGVDRRGLGLLTFGHTGADICQGAVPAMLPFMVAERGYSYSAIGALYLCASLGSSLVQPLFGLYTDRIRASWLMPAGLVLGGLGIGAAGLAPSFVLTAVALLASGLGVAAFHPDAARLASSVAAAKRGAGMSIFAVGGNAGFALGPILVTPAVVAFGLAAAGIVAVVPLAAAALLLIEGGYLGRFRPSPAGKAIAQEPGRGEDWTTFGVASGAAILRTSFQFGLQAFIPSYFVAVLATTEGAGNAAIAAMLAAGAVGTLVGGRFADRFGFRPVIVVSLACVMPLAFALPSVGIAGAVVLLVLIGLVMDANFYPLVVIAQDALPRFVGFASGVVLGLSIGIGALAAWLLGILADRAGLEWTLYVSAGLLALAFLLSLALPREKRLEPRPAPQEPTAQAS